LGKYKVHKFDVKMTSDLHTLEDFLNSLKGEVVAIIPNVTSRRMEYASVDFLLIVEKTTF
jgi:stalled ribosome rescue protein Dom34